MAGGGNCEKASLERGGPGAAPLGRFLDRVADARHHAVRAGAGRLRGGGDDGGAREVCAWQLALT